MQAKTLTGASLKVYINGAPFGVATGISWNTGSGRREIFGLDQVSPWELAPGAQNIGGTIECVRLRYDGGLEGRGIAATNNSLMLEKYISITVVDRVSDLTILQVDKAAVEGQQWSVSSKGVLTGSFTWMAIDWSAENSSL